jgi:ABC-type transport system involved in cytochrome bd biosynthesis fused ATPase/permease subunit
VPFEKSRPDSRRLDGAYRSTLMDITAGRDELLCAGTGAALGLLRETAADKLQADKTSQFANDKSDTFLSILDALTFLLLIAGLIPAVQTGQISGIDLAVYFLVLQTLLLEFRTLPEAMRQACRSHSAAGSLWTKKQRQAVQPVPEEPASLKILPEVSEDDLLFADDVSFSYRQGQELLSHLSFHIKQGQHTAIVGASGAGKTTLAELILGVWPVDEGRFYLQGTAYDQLAVKDLRENISAMPQGSVLFSKSIRENFQLFCPDVSEAAMEQALADAQLTKVVSAMPQGVDTCLGGDACFLSGGQRNRLLTAIAIARPTPLILLDEPTCGLDKKTAADLMQALLRRVQEKGQTLLVITHDEDITKEFAQVIRL